MLRALVLSLSCALAWRARADAPPRPYEPAALVSESSFPRLPAPVEFRLDNGLRVVLAPDESLPDVTVAVRYAAGAGDDPAGLEGLAHLVEHLQFEGSRHFAKGEHTRLLEAAGASQLFGETTPDETLYGETIPSGALELALALESDRMAYPGARVDEAAVAHEQRIALDEYTYRSLDNMFASIDRVVRSEIFPPWHPYHPPLDGMASIVGIRLADVRAFLRTWYTPGNASLVIAGRFDVGRAQALVRTSFGALAAPQSPERPPPGPARSGDVRLTVQASVRDPRVVVAWPTPGLWQPGDRELDLGAYVLAGPGGALERDLVGKNLAYDVEASQGSLLAGSMFEVAARVRDEGDLERVETAIETMVETLSFAVSEKLASRARHAWTDHQVAQLETSAGRARSLSKKLEPGDPWQLGAYARISAASIASAIRTYLSPHSRVAALLHVWRGVLPPGSRGFVERREERIP